MIYKTLYGIYLRIEYRIVIFYIDEHIPLIIS